MLFSLLQSTLPCFSVSIFAYRNKDSLIIMLVRPIVAAWAHICVMHLEKSHAALLARSIEKEGSGEFLFHTTITCLAANTFTHEWQRRRMFHTGWWSLQWALLSSQRTGLISWILSRHRDYILAALGVNFYFHLTVGSITSVVLYHSPHLFSHSL